MIITNEEKIVLITIVIAAVVGLAINFLFSYNNKIQIKAAASERLLVNLNTASMEDFDKLPGIGRIYAERIIKDREKNGPFRSVEGVTRVKGITKRKFEQMKRYLIVTEE